MAGFSPILLLFVMIALLLVCCPRSVHASKQSPPLSRTCFSATERGPASDAKRPCVEVTELFEDGSFSYRVSDADGTVRYSAGVGALDR